MKKINKYIEIVGSSNPRLNAMTRESQLTMQTTLRKQYKKVEITMVNNMPDLKALVVKNPDMVVLGMKLVLLDETMSYDDSPKVWLSDYLYENGITFTGSDTRALVLEFEKQAAKQVVLDADLNSARYFISSIESPVFAHNLTYPLFVKPTNRGDSKGIDERSLVHSAIELKAKIESIHSDCSSDALIEEYLPGREFSVCVIRQPFTNQLIALPIEIVTPTDVQGNTYLSEAVKEADIEEVLAVSSHRVRKALNNLAIGVFVALGARDYGRIDLRMDAEGNPHFIEANLMPGLSDHGYLYRCFSLNQSTTYDEMILSIVSLAEERFHTMKGPLPVESLESVLDIEIGPFAIDTLTA